MSNKQEIQKLVIELSALIKESDTYLKYQLIEDKLSTNASIKDAIEELKTTQKNLVNLRYLKKTEATKLAEERLTQLHLQLKQYPIYAEYMECVDELNQLFQSISKEIQYVVDLKTPKF